MQAEARQIAHYRRLTLCLSSRYDGGHTPDVSGCTALAKGEKVKVLVPRATDDTNAVQVDTQGRIGWTKSYYLDASPVKSN